MRRRDRKITDMAEIGAIFQEARVCRLGFADGNEPYVVPLAFGYGGVCLPALSTRSVEEPFRFFSCLTLERFDRKKIGLLVKNPRVCVEADICDGLVRGNDPCSWGMRYRSVIGYGFAEILADPEEKRHGLNCIMRHYDGGSHDFSAEDLDRVAVIRIRLDSVTAKKKG